MVTTKWLANPTQQESERELLREAELKDIYWKEMLDVGSHFERHDGSIASAHRIITNLLHKPNIKLKLPPGWFKERLKVAREKKSKNKEQEPKSQEQEPMNKEEKASGKEEMPWFSSNIMWEDESSMVENMEEELAHNPFFPWHWPIWKIIWTISRTSTVALVAISAFFLSREEYPPTWFLLLVWTFACALISGLIFGWVIVSHISVLIVRLFAILLSSRDGGGSRAPLWVVIPCCLFALVIGRVLYDYHHPHHVVVIGFPTGRY
jgi:hypothetical protein